MNSWEQGNVGWGVLGAFGSAGKDEGAQGAVHSTKDDNIKMVKNEKGLWYVQYLFQIIVFKM